MLSILLAISAIPVPVGTDVAALGPCAPNKHTACHYEGKRASAHGIPVGKRCHPDPTKSFACREILPSQVRSESGVASR